jgi:succinate dehydrogenase / fumarate reductase membrane anchor subunit
MGVNSGYRDWKLQRISALVMMIYVIYLFAFFVCHPHLSYDCWVGLFASPWMQVSTLVVMLLLVIHAWIGMWTIGTDYIKSLVIRACYQALVFIALLAYFFWVVQIIRSF